jgi:hypothetical protein
MEQRPGMTQGVNFFGKIGKLATARILSCEFLVFSWDVEGRLSF